jgi:hypothetical protein
MSDVPISPFRRLIRVHSWCGSLVFVFSDLDDRAMSATSYGPLLLLSDSVPSVLISGKDLLCAISPSRSFVSFVVRNFGFSG